jgi:hypothetical protein
MRKALEFILSKFPDHRAKIIELHNNDEDFRILCEDYLASTMTLEESRQKVINDREFENEFLQVNLDLEKEIIHLLEKYQSASYNNKAQFNPSRYTPRNYIKLTGAWLRFGRCEFSCYKGKQSTALGRSEDNIKIRPPLLKPYPCHCSVNK